MSGDILAGLDDVLGSAVAAPVSKRTRGKKAVVESVDGPLTDPNLKHHGFSGKRVRIVVERGHDPTDLPTVFLKLNDYSCLIERGKEVDVPVELLHVLDAAEQTGFSQPRDGVLIPHDSLRFPYRIVTGHEHNRPIN